MGVKKDYKHVIIKIGTSSLCDKQGVLSKERMLKIVEQVVNLKRSGIDVTIVSSGAIGAGIGVMKLSTRPTTIQKKQALAAIGQASLMKAYEDLFSLFDFHCAQILVNHDDFDDRGRLLNLSNAMQAINEYGVIAIVNENDTLAVDEIRVGDNDSLASMLVPIVNADLLILLSDIDGLYDDNPHTNSNARLIKEVHTIDDTIHSMAKDSSSSVGTGGMTTKIKAAKIVTDFGCDMVIINNQRDNGIVDVVNKVAIGTYFYASVNTLSSKSHWLLYRTLSKGQLVVDDGAKNAIVLKHTSLLPSGIVDVIGNFTTGQVVDVVDGDGNAIARGIVHYASDEIRLIKGKQSSDIETILQYKDYNEVIHANNLVVIR